LREKGTEPAIVLSRKYSKYWGYGLQADKKTLTVTEPHVNRDAPFVGFLHNYPHIGKNEGK
jgi:hypothetical protein